MTRTLLVLVAALAGLAASGKLWEHAAGTLASVAAAFVLAVASGFLAGVAIHRLPRLRRALDPFFATYYAVPFFVFYPVMVAIFGLSQLPVVAIGYLFALVAMVVNTLNGIDRMDNAVGYLPANVVPCCKDCNFMKKALDAHTFVERCRQVSAAHGGPGEPCESWSRPASCHFCGRSDRRNADALMGCGDCNQAKALMSDDDEFVLQCQRVASRTHAIPDMPRNLNLVSKRSV